MTTPAAFASTLLQASYELISTSMPDVYRMMTDILNMAPVEINKVGVMTAFLQKLRDSPTPTALLASTLDALTRAMGSKGRQHAVIVVDECSILTQWKPEYKKARASLLAFFVRVARQEGLAHVLLVTSESSFVDWIKQGEHTSCHYRGMLYGRHTQ